MIKPIQICQAGNNWTPVQIESESNPGTFYRVLCNPWNEPEANVCECKGYQHNGHCYHQQLASDRLCWWREGQYPKQTIHEHNTQCCPACGGTTAWSMEMT